MPSVRGRERLAVATLFVVSGTASGAAVAFGFALLVAPLPTPTPPQMLLIIGCGLVLDAAGLMIGRPKPPASGRQVPQEWSRLFSPRVVAVLYGSRLGVGPLTILSTWTWWSVTAAAALAGPISAAATGGCFGAVRLLTTVGASWVSGASRSGADQGDHVAWFGRLRSAQRPNWIAINGFGVAAVSMFVLVGCSGGPSTEPQGATSPTSTVALMSGTTVPTARTGSESPASEELINPVELEDVVRTAIEKQLTMSKVGVLPPERLEPDALAIVADDGLVSSDPDSLSEALMPTITGFVPVDDPMADRFLDILAASEIQPDPTEEIALLETRGFVGGWTRAFRSATNDVAVTSVYQFKDATEAEFYLEDGLITIGGYGGKFFDIEGLPGVRGFVQYFTETDEAGSEDLVSLGAAFQAGPRWYLVYFVGSAATVTPEILIPAITAQRQATAGR